MRDILENIYQVLDSVLPGQVSYGQRNSLIESEAYIVYQEISNRATLYADDHHVLRMMTIQVNLVTKEKSLELEERLEVSLTLNKYEFQMLSEYQNQDGSINRVYEIKVEVL